MDEGDRTARGEGWHFVDGRLVACCEEGEDDCPCTCHGRPPGRAGGSLSGP